VKTINNTARRAPDRDVLHRYLFASACAAVLLAAVFVYTRQLTTNPAGFFIDESSVAYNAYTISQDGHDEYGNSWPLYFRAFGEYKNPIYIYLLAAVFRLTGPGIFTARLLSATLGIATAVVIGLIGFRLTKQRWLALVLTVLALLTPWFFALSRIVVEVALYPLLIALFLLAVQRISEKSRWGWNDAICIALTLALLTFTYSIGRLLAPLLAAGLLLFTKRARFWSIARVWLLYAISLLPMFIFRARHPGALEARFKVLTYLAPESRFLNVWEIARHYFHNINPWRMLVTGDPGAYQVASTYGTGPVLIVTLVLFVAGVCLLLAHKQVNAWWAFVIYGLVISFVPASLTRDYFHILRLSPVPVFMILLAVPALAWLTKPPAGSRRALIVIALIVTVAQGGYFQYVHAKRGREVARLNIFDADYHATIMPAAIAAAGSGPVYVRDAQASPGYIQALWYATLDHMLAERFVILTDEANAPPGGVVISTKPGCTSCEVLFERSPYRVYIAK
jgi:4-amino-4-deoxy-L-arabinose transferase-like glycosyltransferase